MENGIIDKMASDMGISPYKYEDENSYLRRVIYSGMSCWIKTSTLDKPIGSGANIGVSRRHVQDRCSKVMDSLLEFYPDVKPWFYKEDNNAVGIIRDRLIRHGDILNEGFKTNIVLAKKYSIPLTKTIDVIYGTIFQDEAFYSGVSLIRLKDNDLYEEDRENAREWLENYASDAWWESGIQKIGEVEGFDPYINAKNNYSLWQARYIKCVNNLALVRIRINNVGFEYYLIRKKEDLFHRLDPLMLEIGEHRRIMLALRAMANNPATSFVERFDDCMKLNMSFRIPTEELGLLEAYAWPIEEINNELNWIMPVEIGKYVIERMRALCIRIKEIQHG